MTRPHPTIDEVSLNYLCPQLCDDGFAVNFNTKNLFLRKLNYVLTGYRDSITSLYLIFLYNATTPPCRIKPRPLTSTHTFT